MKVNSRRPSSVARRGGGGGEAGEGGGRGALVRLDRLELGRREISGDRGVTIDTNHDLTAARLPRSGPLAAEVGLEGPVLEETLEVAPPFGGEQDVAGLGLLAAGLRGGGLLGLGVFAPGLSAVARTPELFGVRREKPDGAAEARSDVLREGGGRDAGGGGDGSGAGGGREAGRDVHGTSFLERRDDGVQFSRRSQTFSLNRPSARERTQTRFFDAGHPV